MKLLPLFRYGFATGWRSLIGWSIGIVAVLSLYMPLFPSLAAGGQMQELLNKLPDQLVKTLGYEQIATGSGYVSSTFFGLMGFILFSIAAIAWGSNAVAGDEESGTLELTLAHAVSRTQVILEGILTLAAKLLVLAAVAVGTILLLNPMSKTHLSVGHVLLAMAALFGLALLGGLAALATGAIIGRHTIALTVGTIVIVVGYMFNAISKQVSDAAWLRHLSPYSWAFDHNPLTTGADTIGLIALYGGCIVLAVVAWFAFNHRDVTG